MDRRAAFRVVGKDGGPVLDPGLQVLGPDGVGLQHRRQDRFHGEHVGQQVFRLFHVLGRGFAERFQLVGDDLEVLFQAVDLPKKNPNLRGDL